MNLGTYYNWTVLERINWTCNLVKSFNGTKRTVVNGTFWTVKVK